MSANASTSSDPTDVKDVTIEITTVETNEGSLQLRKHPDSNVLQVRNGTDGRFLYNSAHLVSFKPISKPSDNSTRYLSSFRLAYEAGGYIAAIHLNQRNSSIVQNLAERMRLCSRDDNYLRYTYEMVDTQMNRLEALRNLQEVASRDISTETELQQDLLVQQSQLPFPPLTAMIGGAASAVSMSLASLSGVYEIPQVSGLSSAAVLDDKTKTPFFSRMYPSNLADADALMLLWKDWGVTHFGCIYGRDLYGTAFGGGVITAAQANGITVYESAYEVEDLHSLRKSLLHLQSTNVKYIFGIFHANSWKQGFQMAHDLGIMGHSGYTWVLSDNTNQVTSSEFTLAKSDETGNPPESDDNNKIARAINGVGVLTVHFQQNPVLKSIIADDFANNPTLQEDFVQAHRANMRHLFDTFDWVNDPLQPSIYVDLVYDAAITAGLSACELVGSEPTPFFTGPQLLQQIRRQAFNGSSAYVSVNNMTGTRDSKGLQYTVTNVVLSENDTGDIWRFEAEPKVFIALSPPEVVFQSPYIFADNTSQVPPDLPPLQHDKNLIPREILAAGWVVCGVLMVGALLCGAFVIRNRDQAAVMSAQPPFLLIICLGTLLIASTIIPMTFQDDQGHGIDSTIGLDVACMSTVYVFSIGFVIVFSSLYCKTHRILQLVESASRFRRVQIEVKDVLYPLIILLSVNLALLITWSAVDPLIWTRIVVESGGQDETGRSTESYGVCASSSDTNQKIFTSLYAIANLLALFIANWECYKARDLPNRVNETDRIATVMFILLECAILGIPVLFVVRDNPTANFGVRTVMIAVVCIAILVPLFLPLWRECTGEDGPERRRTVTLS